MRAPLDDQTNWLRPVILAAFTGLVSGGVRAIVAWLLGH